MPGNARHSLKGIVPPNGGKGKPFVSSYPSRKEALFCSNFSGGNQRPSRGRSAGVHFEWPKWTKSHLGRSPLRTPLGYEAVHASSLSSARHPYCGSCYCHHTRLPWAAGPMARWFPPPGLLWKSGVPAAGSQATDSWEQRPTRVRPWE